MHKVATKGFLQEAAEEKIGVFRRYLGPFVVAAEKTRMPMIFTDASEPCPIVFANDAFLMLTGYGRDEVLAKTVNSLLCVGTDPDTMAKVDSAFRGENVGEPVIHCTRKDGSEFWASIFLSPVHDENGVVLQQFASFVDLTGHRQEIARSKLLIDELNHRVKNMLSTVQSIVTEALRRPLDPAAIRHGIESRILALSCSHDLLTSSNWGGAGLHALVNTALQPFEVVTGYAERFTIAGDDVHLTSKTTLALAIVFNELATNAIKYGAFSNDSGMIEIDWTIEPSLPGDRLVLRWRERDGPPVTLPTRRGFGSWVIERGLTHELGGTVALEYPTPGLICSIDIPIQMEATA